MFTHGILALSHCVIILICLACSLCVANHIIFVVISHYFHACILMLCHCSCLAFVFVIFVMGSQKVYITFLIACIGHHGNDCKRTMIPNTLWVRRDVLPSSCGLPSFCYSRHRRIEPNKRYGILPPSGHPKIPSNAYMVGANWKSLKVKHLSDWS